MSSAQSVENMIALYRASHRAAERAVMREGALIDAGIREYEKRLATGRWILERLDERLRLWKASVRVLERWSGLGQAEQASEALHAEFAKSIIAFFRPLHTTVEWPAMGEGEIVNACMREYEKSLGNGRWLRERLDERLRLLKAERVCALDTERRHRIRQAEEASGVPHPERDYRLQQAQQATEALQAEVLNYNYRRRQGERVSIYPLPADEAAERARITRLLVDAEVERPSAARCPVDEEAERTPTVRVYVNEEAERAPTARLRVDGQDGRAAPTRLTAEPQAEPAPRGRVVANQRGNRGSINQLPDEVFARIFEYTLDALHDDAAFQWTLANVCRRWQGILFSNPCLWLTFRMTVARRLRSRGTGGALTTVRGSQS